MAIMKPALKGRNSYSALSELGFYFIPVPRASLRSPWAVIFRAFGAKKFPNCHFRVRNVDRIIGFNANPILSSCNPINPASDCQKNSTKPLIVEEGKAKIYPS
jgi:hypothetical protein